MAVPTSFITPEVVQGTTTSWLPVTTAYPSISGCAQAFFLYPGQPFPEAWDPGYGYFAGGSLNCLPPQETSWWEQGHQNPDGYTSLSIQPIICPEAFTTAATEVRSDSSTLVRCCPSGYDLQDGQPGRVTGDCRSTITSGQVITYTAQAANFSWVSETLTATSATDIAAVPMDGWNVSPSTTSSTLITSGATPSSTSTTVSSTSHGLSTGAKAGIGVGVAIGVIGLICLAFFIGRQQRRPPPHDYATPKPGMSKEASDPRHEIYTRLPAQEMYQRPSELESGQGLKPKFSPHISDGSNS